MSNPAARPWSRRLSSYVGKDVRISRIIDPRSKKAFILALDHGFTLGPLPGLENIARRLLDIGKDAPDAVIMHQGMVSRVSPLFSDYQRLGLIVHLSGATQLSPRPNEKQLVCSVEHALRLGADGVSVHVNIGSATENEMLKDLGYISEQCQQWGLPLIGMMYPRGENVKDPHDPSAIALAIRVAMELGVDIIKVPYTGNIDSFARILQDVDVPIVVAGGAKLGSEREVIQLAYDVLQAGAQGISFGRNIFQSEHPNLISKAIGVLVHHGGDFKDAMAVLEEGRAKI